MSTPGDTTEIAHTPLSKPHADQGIIRSFLGRMFARAKPEQLVEIAWSDDSGKPNTAKLFPCTPAGLDAATAAAASANSRQRNVYFGVHPRRAGTPRDKRSYDHHVEEALWQFVDGDTPEADEAYTWDGFKVPTALEVQTGNAPHPRRHLYWELDEAEGDLSAWKLRQKALAAHYAGDKSVHNPSRIMRLPGCVSYPHAKKIEKGYRVEAVQVTADSPLRTSAAVLADTFHAAEIERVERVEKKDGTELSRAIANLQAGIELHNNARTAVNGLLANGTPPEAVEALLTSMLEGVSDGGTLKELPGLIRSAVAKGIARDAPEAEFEDIEITAPAHDASPAQAAPLLDMLCPASLAGTEPAEQEWLVKDWLAVGTVVALYGDGGLGKTLLAQQLMTACAVGEDWLGLPTKQCKSIGLFCEDDATEMHRRQKRINAFMGCEMEDLSDIKWSCRVGQMSSLIQFGRDGAATLTPLWHLLVKTVKAHGARLVVLDTAADVFEGDENVRAQVRQFLSLLNGLAQAINGVVLLCAHPSRSGMASGRGDGGSTAWHNGVRARLYLARPDAGADVTPDPDARVLTMPKNNRARAGEAIPLRWSEGALVVELSELNNVPDNNLAAPERVEAAFLEALDALNKQGLSASASPNATSYAPKAMKGMPQVAGIRSGDLVAAMKRLFNAKAIEVGSLGKGPNRHDRIGLRKVGQNA